jgi:general secretion pathway protein G
MLIELIAVVAILGVIALIIVPRMSSQRTSGNRTSCFNQKAEIELQVKLWRRNNGSYPAANLSNIGADTGYFPNGLPICPVDGTAYTINTTTGRVTGHAH